MRYLIAGLGNPGSAYDNTRHNIGFRTAERTAERLGAKIGKKKFRSLCAEAVYSDEKLLIIKPQTFMNASGEALREAKEFYRIAVERIIVVYDELDIPLGNIRVNRGGGSAGHNGIRVRDSFFGFRRILQGKNRHREALGEKRGSGSRPLHIRCK